MQAPVRVGPFAGNDHIWVVIETPAGSRTKYKWDEDARAYRAGRVLPLGMAFPFEVERQGRVYELVGKVGVRAARALVNEAKR